jgi:low affinity Fe/Cu permease
VVLYSASSCVTLLMVFVIQHSSTRQQLSMQRKLDELLRALPDADDRVIAVEEAPDDELEELAGQSLERRERAGQRIEG